MPYTEGSVGRVRFPSLVSCVTGVIRRGNKSGPDTIGFGSVPDTRGVGSRVESEIHVTRDKGARRVEQNP